MGSIGERSEIVWIYFWGDFLLFIFLLDYIFPCYLGVEIQHLTFSPVVFVQEDFLENCFLVIQQLVKHLKSENDNTVWMSFPRPGKISNTTSNNSQSVLSFPGPVLTSSVYFFAPHLSHKITLCPLILSQQLTFDCFALYQFPLNH